MKVWKYNQLVTSFYLKRKNIMSANQQIVLERHIPN